MCDDIFIDLNCFMKSVSLIAKSLYEKILIANLKSLI